MRATALLLVCLGCGHTPPPHAAFSTQPATSTAAPVSDALVSAIDPNDPRLARLANGSLKWNYVPTGDDHWWGHAEGIIAAPVPLVRTRVGDFVHYRDYSHGRLRTSRVVDKHGTQTDVYLQMPVLKGLIMLWQVVRFEAIHPVSPGVFVLEGKFVQGNVDDARLSIRMSVIDASRTLVEVDMLIVPSFSAPQAAVDEELRDSAKQALDTLGELAETDYIAQRERDGAASASK